MEKNRFTPQGRLKNVVGTITAPETAGLRIIVSACSESGDFKTPLQSLLTKRWAKVREDYRGWYASRQNWKLGQMTTTAVASDIWVAHMLCQDKNNAFDTKAATTCIKSLVALAKSDQGSLHVSNLLVKDYPELKTLLNDNAINEGVSVYYYDEK